MRLYGRGTPRSDQLSNRAGALLGHADHSTTQRYAHLANDPFAAASEQIGRIMLEAMTGTAQTEVSSSADAERTRT